MRENGLRLAAATGAKAHVVELFAVLHDACRLNHEEDRGHGPRAARFASQLLGRSFELSPEDFELLVTAIRDHSKGLREGDVTVLTCWDADRLDLGRVGERPRAERLCTQAARDPGIMAWAYERSVSAPSW